MALPHAQLLDVIDVSPLKDKLPTSPSTSLIKTARVQLLHLVLHGHEDHPLHHVADECTVHCLEGRVEVVFPGGVRQLQANQVIVLPAQQVHSLRAREPSTVLMTLLLMEGDAGDKGGDRGGDRSSNQGSDRHGANQ
jgi:quercetin dioxygenase-like cupin family protein